MRCSELQAVVAERARHCTRLRDEDGRAVLHMNVKNDDSFLCEFSQSEQPVISEGVADFLERAADAYAADTPLALHIRGDCIDEHEQQVYRDAIREHYLQRTVAVERELRRGRRLSLALGILGVLVLAVCVLYDVLIGNAVWSEVIDVVAWVLLWEATDIALLQMRGLRVQRRRYYEFLRMTIIYR